MNRNTEQSKLDEKYGKFYIVASIRQKVVKVGCKYAVWRHKASSKVGRIMVE